MKIFITGATGFLGSNLVKMLVKQGVNVTILCRNKSKHPFLNNLDITKVEGDITNYTSVLNGMKGCSHAYHTAGLLSYRKIDLDKLIEVNVKGTKNVCKAALNANIKKLVHVSSTSAVGIPKNKDNPADETYPFHTKWNRNPYMMTKRLSEEVALEFAEKGLNVVVVNPSTFYGPGDIKIHSGEVFKNINSGNLRIVPPGGTGVIAIEDCVRGLIAAMDKGIKGQRYILNGENLTLIQLFNTIANLLDKSPITKKFPKWTYLPLYFTSFIIEEVSRIFGKSPIIDCGTIDMAWQFRYFDSTKSETQLGWKPSVSFKQTCKHALDFYRSEGII